MAVMYHYVHDRPPFMGLGPIGSEHAVRGPTPTEFAAQLDRLCETMEPITWPELYAWRSGRGTIPPRSFMLTFDDGLADHRQTVLPILEHRGLKGTFFVAGTGLMTQRMLPAHAIHVLLSLLGDERFERELNAALAAFGSRDAREMDTKAAEALYDYETKTRARLKYLLNNALPIDLRDAVIYRLFGRFVGSSARWAKAWYLGWEDVVELYHLGHTIGGHGYSHEPLTRLTPEQRRQDLERVAAVLRSGLGSDIRPLSYPFGRWDADTGRACREMGFVHAFTTEPGWIGESDDLMSLPRVDTITVATVLEESGEWMHVQPQC